MPGEGGAGKVQRGVQGNAPGCTESTREVPGGCTGMVQGGTGELCLLRVAREPAAAPCCSVLCALPPAEEEEEEKQEEGYGAVAAPAQPLAGCFIGMSTEICHVCPPQHCLLPRVGRGSWI